MVIAMMTTPWMATRVRKSWVEVAIPLMIRRPRRRVGSNAPRESSTRTMSATSRVTALPLPMATPTWAALSARASLTPSPTMTT